MHTEEFNGKNAVVLGMGRSGIAACRALKAEGAEVTAADTKAMAMMDPALVAELEEAGAAMSFGEMPPSDGVDFLVISPGVPLTDPYVEKVREAGGEILGELELAYRIASDATWLAITGTNGKTTTTTLVGEIVAAAGKPMELVGNIGIAAADRVLEGTPDTWYVAEVSSFQLESIRDFKPKVAALLNVTPDHLDRHKTMENYGAAKARVFENQDEEGYAVVNFDEKIALSLSTDTKATVVPFSRLEDMKFGACVRDDKIIVIDGDENVTEICGVDELKIPGTHNLENALAAVAVTFFAGIDPEAIRRALTSFEGVEHRIEYVDTVDGVRYINDSKGTNPDAAIKAIEAMDKRTVIIAGGYDKGADFSEFIEAFGDKVYYAVLIGKTAVKIKDTAEHLGFTDTIIVEDMDQAVREAARVAEEGDVVLLSPACASWDMYTSFEERGRHFKECVAALKEEK